jgi:hypothetical protein
MWYIFALGIVSLVSCYCCLCDVTGKELLCVMWMVLSSCLRSVYLRLYELSLLNRNLIAAYLCCDGWLEV